MMMYGRTLSRSSYAIGTYPGQGLTFMNPVVQQRIRQTMMYFGGGLGMTGLLVGLLRNSAIAYTNPWILLFGSLGLLIGT